MWLTYHRSKQSLYVCACVCEYSECLHIHIWIPSWKINFLEPLRDWQSVRGRIARCIHTLSITWPTVDRPFTLLFLPRRVSLIIHPTNQPSIYPSISGEWVSEYTHCTRMFVLRETDRQTDMDVVEGGECGRYVYIDRDTNVKMLSAGPTTMTTNDVNNINVNNERKQRHQPTDRPTVGVKPQSTGWGRIWMRSYIVLSNGNSAVDFCCLCDFNCSTLRRAQARIRICDFLLCSWGRPSLVSLCRFVATSLRSSHYCVYSFHLVFCAFTLQTEDRRWNGNNSQQVKSHRPRSTEHSTYKRSVEVNSELCWTELNWQSTIEQRIPTGRTTDPTTNTTALYRKTYTHSRSSEYTRLLSDMRNKYEYEYLS